MVKRNTFICDNCHSVHNDESKIKKLGDGMYRGKCYMCFRRVITAPQPVDEDTHAPIDQIDLLDNQGDLNEDPVMNNVDPQVEDKRPECDETEDPETVLKKIELMFKRFKHTTSRWNIYVITQSKMSILYDYPIERDYSQQSSIRIDFLCIIYH
ncbi:hypothetical protein QAD02_002078 [Eretmocerus hayati]|uniref:Uncharacterized protein n=1 Tax=Eretmocerus hayati TaxID=131215 RepID=A0ACC2NKH2_9HYME|nr:hypothetical protein QAD02_002078 [Eretmocerus hayati]